MDQPDIKRKRVTQVGSGAFAVYLPKRWIDSWTPQQRASREVELRLVSERILLTPMHRESSFEAFAPPRDARRPARLRDLLLSAYVRGYAQARVRPRATLLAHGDDGSFDADEVAATRAFLRHLDERLVAVATPGEVGFDLPDLPAPPASAEQLLGNLAAKVRDVLWRAADAVEHASEPERALHDLRLLRSTCDEDVARVFHQTLRLVANLELPLGTVSDFQLLDLAAANLNRVGAHGLHLADVLLRAEGFTLADLDYPRDHLLARVRPRGPEPAVARALRRGYAASFADAQRLLAALLPALRDRDAEALAEVSHAAAAAQVSLEERVFRAAADHWGPPGAAGPAAGTAAFHAYQLSTPIAGILGNLGTVGRYGVALLAAAPPQSRAVGQGEGATRGGAGRARATGRRPG